MDSSWAIYCRVSHRSSALSGLSIEDQYHQCLEYVRRYLKGVTPYQASYPPDNAVGCFFDRAVSAWSKKISNRPGGFAMCQALKPGGHLVIYSIDRGFRNMADFATTLSEWDRAGITPHFVEENIDGSSAFGRFFLHVRAAAAQCFSDLISQRIRESQLIKKHITKAAMKSNSVKKERISSEFRYLKSQPLAKTQAISGRIWRYERCSTNRQYISGLGLAVQSTENLEHANHLKVLYPELEVLPDACVDEAVSAYSVPFNKRPMGKKIWDEAKAGDHVIVYRLDRAWRSVSDAIHTIEEMQARGVQFHFVCERINTTSDTGLQTLSLLAWAASMESKMKSRRLRSISASLREQGRGFGEVPRYGMVRTVNGKRKIVMNPRAIRLMALAWAARLVCGFGYNNSKRVCIAYHCAENGIEPKRAYWPPDFKKESWTSTVTTMFPRLKEVMPEKAWQAIAWQAISRLQTALPEKYVKYLFPTDTMFSKIRLTPPPFKIDIAKAEEMIGSPAPDLVKIGA